MRGRHRGGEMGDESLSTTIRFRDFEGVLFFGVGSRKKQNDPLKAIR